MDLGKVFLVARYSIIRAKWNHEEKLELQKKVDRIICVREITFLAAHPSSYVIFCCFVGLIPPFCLFRFYVEKKVLFQKMLEATHSPRPVPTALLL